MPSDWAAIPMRPPSKLERAMANPRPSSPRMFSFGMRQSVSVSAQVSEAFSPILSSIASTVKPGVSVGIKKAERSEEHTSELQSRFDLVCRLLLEKKKNKQSFHHNLLKQLHIL